MGISECEHTGSLYPSQIRIQVRWRCEYKVETMYNHNNTIFSWHWCQLNCMHAYIVSLEVRICLLTVHFFFLAQNGAIASIMNNIRYKVLEEAQFCDFCAGSLAIVLGHCTKCKTSLSVCYYWNMKYYLYSKADNMKYFVRGWLMSCWYLPLKQESRSFSKLYVSKSIRETHF